MKKSGLTLLKVNHSTLREKPEGQWNYNFDI